MRYYYDLYGFLTDHPITGRETHTAPPDEAEWPEGKRPNWTGYAWVYLDYPPSQPVPTLQEAISSTVAAIDAHAASLRDPLTAGTHPAEMARWPFKLAEAKAFAISDNWVDAPTLTIEATTRGIPVADLVAKVLAKAELLAQHEAAIAGTAGKHKDVVRAMTDVDAVLTYDWHVGWPTFD